MVETIGNTIDQIPVTISYRIIELFSAGLYSSPNKAFEELVSNSYDAMAKNGGSNFYYVVDSKYLKQAERIFSSFCKIETTKLEKLYTYNIDGCWYFAIKIIPRKGRNEHYNIFADMIDLRRVHPFDFKSISISESDEIVRRQIDIMIEEFRKVCYNNKIDITKTCIVGSSVLALLGLRENHDIDFVTTHDIRNKYGSQLYKFTNEIELVKEGWARSPYRQTISDDDLITNSDYHYLYRGIKFASLPLLYERKIAQNRPKDRDDIIDIELIIQLIASNRKNKTPLEL